MPPMFNFQPTLTNDRVTLRPLVADDWDALFAVASDREIWALHPAHDRWQEPVFRGFFAEGLASGGALVALDPASGTIIGASRYDLTRAKPDEIEIGWTFLARSRWGGPTNHAMKTLMVGHALTGFASAIFVIGEHNVRSRRAMEKIGATLTDRVYDAIVAGIPTCHVIYAIDQSAFANGPLTTTPEGKA